MRRLLRLGGWLVLGALLVAGLTALTALLVARTDWGRQRILGLALPAVQQRLAGRVHIGGLEGGLTRGLVLHDVEIFDAEGQLAVRVATLRLGYDLGALRRRELDLTELRIEGGWVHARTLRDGSLNLATLLAPSEGGGESTIAIRLDHVWAEVEGRYDREEQSIRGAAHVEGHALVRGGDVAATLELLRARATAPLAAELSGHGAVTITRGAIAADGVALTLVADGAELRRLWPEIARDGRWQLEARASGPAERLTLSLVARPPAGQLAVEGQLRASGHGLGWQATAHATGIDPAALLARAPHGELRLEAKGRGEGATGSIDLGTLAARVAGTTLDAHGTVGLDGDARLDVQVASRDLSQLRTLSLGIEGAGALGSLGGRLTAKARVERSKQHLRIEGDVSAEALTFGATRVATLAAHVREEDLVGEAHLAAKGVQAGGLAFDTLNVAATGRPRALRASIQGRGPDQSAVDLVVHGSRDELTIDELALGRHGQRWANRGPARLRLQDVVELSGLELDAGEQRLAVDGSYASASGALQAHVRGQKLDARELVRLVRPGVELPETALAVDARVTGTRAHPRIDGSLDGYSEAAPQLDLERLRWQLVGHWAEERLAADWTVTATAAAQTLRGKLDVPTTLAGDRPLKAEFAASHVPVAKLRKLLPARLAALDGILDGTVAASGTTRRPIVSVRLHGAGLQLGSDAKDNDLRVEADYRDERLQARAALTLRQSLGSDAGALVAQGELPIDLAPARLLQSRRLLEQLEHKTPIVANVTLRRLDLARMPLQALGLAPPVVAGTVDGTIALRGTLHEPTLDAQLQGHGLAWKRLDKVELQASLGYTNRRATVSVDATLRGAALLRARGAAPIDVQRVIDGEPYLDTQLELDANVPGFELARVRDLVPTLAGRLDAHAEVRGTLGSPHGTLDATVAGLSLGQMQANQLTAHGDFDGATLTGRIDAREAGGGTLAAEANVPLDAGKPVAASLRAQHFVLDVGDVSVANLRRLQGTLEASLTLRGPRANPALEGFVRLDRGQLALSSEARVYQDIKVDVSVRGGALTLERLSARLGSGTVSATGGAQLMGLQPQKLELRVETKSLPIPTGAFNAWVDSTVSVHGERTAGGMSGTVTLEKGTANLPKIADSRNLQKTGPLKDVKFVDARARKAEATRKKAESQAPTVELVARIPGPFRVRSRELSTDLSGELELAIAGPVVRIRGEVETGGGWLELLGRRYTIDKARVGFHGEPEPNPELDVRLTRELTNARLVIEVHGTAKKPQLVLMSDPPIYDQSQVIAAILSGDPATQRFSDSGLDSKVTGAISGLLVGKIKDQIAPNLPIDVIRVDTGSQGPMGSADTRIEVGKYITDSIYVSYVHQFGNTYVGTQRFNANEADLEWRFRKRFGLAAAFGDAAVGRVNLFWTIRY